jgi:heptosyltransferase II
VDHGRGVGDPAAVKTVLVVRFGALGDIVLTSGAIATLARAWPDARILFVTKARFADVMRYNPHIHEMVARRDDESIWDLRDRVADMKPDAALDLHGKIASRIICSTAKVRRRWHKRPWTQSLAVRLRLARHRAKATVAQRYHAAVESLVGEKLPRAPMRLYVGESERAAVARLAVRGGATPGVPLVGMAPGASWETKRWPAERFAELAARVLAGGAQVALTGSPAERAILDEVKQRVPGVLTFANDLPMPLLSAFIERCDAFVANDSGPMHIARAVGVPTLALFGSTDPALFEFTGHAALSVDLPCAPCSLYGLERCPKGHFRCMLDLDVDRAWKSLQSLLSAGRPSLVLG